MSSTWLQLRLHYDGVITQQRKDVPALMAIVNSDLSFSYPDHLIHWFHEPGTDATAKSNLYRGLLAAGHAGPFFCLAKALVVLGLWPGLDHAHRRIRVLLSEEGRTHIDADEVTNAVHAAIEFQLQNRDYSSIKKVFGCFVNRVRKQALEALRGGRPGRRRHFSIDGLEIPQEDSGLAAVDDEDAMHAIRRQLLAVLSQRDVALMIKVRIEGLTGKEAAGLFGLTHDGVRARLSAAKKKILAEIPDLASHFGLEPPHLSAGGCADPEEPDHA